jgi:hypothetical protein
MGRRLDDCLHLPERWDSKQRMLDLFEMMGLLERP